MTGLSAAFNGAWEDTDGNSITIRGESVLGPSGETLDLVIESSNTCLMQMGDEFYEGKLSEDGSRILWSDGESWRRSNTSVKQLASAKPQHPNGRIDDAHKRPTLTLQQALRLQEELRKGFSCPKFQMKLTSLSRKHPDGGLAYNAERSELFLEVQSLVLPRYGFAGTQKGVIDMLTAAGHLNNNPEYRRNRDDLNRLLGLAVESSSAQQLARQENVDEPTFLNRHSDLASAHRHLLGSSSLELKLPAAARRNGKASSPNIFKPDGRCENGSSQDIAEMLRYSNQQVSSASAPAPADIEICAREALGDLEVKVLVAATATFNDLKEAISRHVGRPDILRRGHLVTCAEGNYMPFKSTAAIGSVREVLVLRASLEVHDDSEAQAWRRELEDTVSQRQAKRQDAVAAARRRQEDLARHERETSSRAQASRDNADREQDVSSDRVAPHGNCYIVGTWDDFSGKHGMAWDGHAYRIGMNLQGTDKVSFQILAHDAWDSRIHPSIDDASPSVPHGVVGPDSEKSEHHWTLYVDSGDNQDDTAYEIVLNCPQGQPMYLQWDKISLDSIAWYPTGESE